MQKYSTLALYFFIFTVISPLLAYLISLIFAVLFSILMIPTDMAGFALGLVVNITSHEIKNFNFGNYVLFVVPAYLAAGVVIYTFREFLGLRKFQHAIFAAIFAMLALSLKQFLFIAHIYQQATAGTIVAELGEFWQLCT